MQKLVYITHGLDIGGVEVALISAIPDLNKNFKLRVLVLGSINPQLIADLSASEKEVFEELNYPIIAYPICWIFIIAKIKEINPDILISSLWRSSLIAGIYKRVRPKVKYFAFIHNTKFFHFLDEKFSKMALKKADSILVDSVSSMKFVKEIFSGKQVSVVSFLTNHGPKTNIVRSLEDRKKIRFLYLGRIHRVKNLGLALELIKFLKDKGLNVCLDIYGRDDGDKENVKRQIIDSNLEGECFFRGQIPHQDRFGLFRDYDFFIQTSDFEGMAMSVAEAMQNGLPCIITPVGEIPNYSSDMISAIYLNKYIDEKTKLDQFNKVLDVIHTPSLYASISRQSHLEFANKKIYSESLIEQIK